jgi:N-acetylglucosaminyl-diphospho-decaprenol L-rhamnosyltransferase
VHNPSSGRGYTLAASSSLRRAFDPGTRPVEIDKNTVTVVVVTYNNADHIDDCLRSISAQLPNEDSHIVVLDNASKDDTANFVEQRWRSVTLIRSSANLGFAQACNLATGGLGTQFILLTNPDATLNSGCIDALLDVAARYPEAGLYGGRCYSPDGRVDPKSCFGRPTLWGLFCFTTGISTIFSWCRWLNPDGIGTWLRDAERNVGVVSGALLLIDRAVWERLGGFDDHFFMYGEDFDLNIRASAIGCKPMITPMAGMVHIGGASSSPVDKQILLFRGKITLARKLWRGPKRAAAEHFIVGGVWVRAILANIRQSHPTCSGRRQISPQVWSTLWHRRREWRDGWAVDRSTAPS